MSLQQHATAPGELSHLERQRLADYESGDLVPEIMLGIVDNYTKMTLQLMKMMESAEEDKTWLQASLDLERRQRDTLQATLDKAQGRIAELEESQEPRVQHTHELESLQPARDGNYAMTAPKRLQEEPSVLKDHTPNKSAGSPD